MPKKKKKLRKKRSADAHASKTQSDEQTPGAKAARTQPSLKERLYRDDAAGLAQALAYLPLFLGAWTAGGLVLPQVGSFILVTGALIIAHYYQSICDRKDVPFAEMLHMLLLIPAVLSVLAVYALSGNFYLAILTALVAVMTALEPQIPADTPRRILLRAISLIIRPSVLAVIGILSQVYDIIPVPQLVHTVLGFPIGFLLAASFVARHSKLLQNAGWQRSREVTKKDGSTVTRPGRLTQVFSLFLVLGPAIPVTLTPLQVYPPPFLFCCLAFFFVPKITEAFFKGTIPDRQLVVHTANLAAGLSPLLLAAALLAKYGF